MAALNPSAVKILDTKGGTSSLLSAWNTSLAHVKENYVSGAVFVSSAQAFPRCKPRIFCKYKGEKIVGNIGFNPMQLSPYYT